ncbi:MAG: F0F1 ATP synthase subunit B [Crocinitomicaceae bacterium]|nr:F0F1 ATP synthase subunit B [Crocinitomicaceae bacterium]MBP6033496.1 F0F1 ATP synthase subunit B [Crocinitomicaceae bacterium]
MDLILPDLGLLFWTGIVFCLLLFLLAKFAWKPILNAVNAREQKISEALELAVKTQAEMKALKAENDLILKEARAERDNILKEAKEAANNMIEDAKTKSKVEAQRIVEAARLNINSEKAAAIAEIKTHVATLAVEIAEKVVRGELASDEKQKALAEKLAGDIQMN